MRMGKIIRSLEKGAPAKGKRPKNSVFSAIIQFLKEGQWYKLM